jgi:hypothetical protein
LLFGLVACTQKDAKKVYTDPVIGKWENKTISSDGTFIHQVLEVLDDGTTKSITRNVPLDGSEIKEESTGTWTYAESTLTVAGEMGTYTYDYLASDEKLICGGVEYLRVAE